MTPITISQTEDQYENVYDSDFTQGSPSPTLCYATPYLSSTVHAHPPSSFDPSLYALIPSEMYAPPILPADMLWHCPVGGGTCSYFINLCNPSDENLRPIKGVVPQGDIMYLLEKNWKSNDEQVHMVFCEMVNAHWKDHLKELDIKYVQHGDTVSHILYQ
jgi:hypothetical protein